MAAFDLSAIMKALDQQGYQNPGDSQANPFGVAGGMNGIMAALAQQGYRPPGMTNTQNNPFGVAGGISSIADAVAAQGQFGPQAQNNAWGFNGNTGQYVPAAGPMGLGNGVYKGGMQSAHGQTAIGPPQVFKDPNPAPPTPKPGELPRAPAQMWAGGFGQSDGSAWGNKGDAAQMSRSGVSGSLKEMPGQSANAAAGGFQNAMLPGAGSVFGLGGAR